MERSTPSRCSPARLVREPIQVRAHPRKRNGAGADSVWPVDPVVDVLRETFARQLGCRTAIPEHIFRSAENPLSASGKNEAGQKTFAPDD